VRITDGYPPSGFVLPDNEPVTGFTDPKVVGADHGCPYL
jgi:hypothetical protein